MTHEQKEDKKARHIKRKTAVRYIKSKEKIIMYKFKTESYNMKDAASEIFELTKRGWAIISVSPDTKHENDIVVVYRKKVP